MCESLRKRQNDLKILRSIKTALSIAILFVSLLCLTYGSAVAISVPVGSDSWSLRWDNTLRYTLQGRVADQDGAILANSNADDGDRNFKDGIVSNRIDILSEMDLVYKNSHGIRVSGAFWNDEVYDNDYDNDSIETSNYLQNGEQRIGLYSHAQQYFEGPSGELLDAFVFTELSSGDVPFFFKAGRHTVYWGEALLSAFHGISYGQMPLDLAKATAQPGVEAKEVFRPVANFSVVSPVTTSLTISAQYFFEWQRSLVPECGTYFGSSDLSFQGDGALILQPGVLFTHGRDIKPREYEDWGISARWSPGFLNGDTIGFYYRNFSDTLPHAIINTATGTYHYAFPQDIDLVGLSYATELFGLSLGAEVSYRHEMPLVSEAIVIDDSSLLPEQGETLGARGETLHALINFIGLLTDNALWDAGNWNIEFAYSRWLSVNKGKEYFKGRHSYNAFDRVTEDNGVIAANFNPQWMQVFPGVDLTVPMTVSTGLWGVSSVTNGGGEKDGSWGVGLTFDILSRHQVKLNYVNFFGELDKDPETGIGTARGGAGLLKDRDFVALTIKTSF